MRKASKVLGIVGGSLSLAVGLLCIIGAVVMMTVGPDFFTSLMDIFDDMNATVELTSDFMFNWTAQIGGIVILIFGVFKIACGVIGLVGGIIVPKKNVTAGVLMIVAAAVSLLLAAGWITTILFTLGGIFALVKEKPNPEV